MAPNSEKLTKLIDGLPVPRPFSDHLIRSAFRMVPREKDLFVASYPKTGTTWMQYVLYAIRNMENDEMPDFGTLKTQLSPFLDATDPHFIDQMSSPRMMTHHYPAAYAPFNLDTKTIYTVRNPLDTLVSFYHYHRSRTAARSTGDPFAPIDFVSLDEYFELFLAGSLPYGDFSDHVLSWFRLNERY